MTAGFALAAGVPLAASPLAWPLAAVVATHLVSTLWDPTDPKGE